MDSLIFADSYLFCQPWEGFTGVSDLGQIRDFFTPDFRRFWLKIRICPIRGQSDPVCGQIWHVCDWCVTQSVSHCVGWCSLRKSLELVNVCLHLIPFTCFDSLCLLWYVVNCQLWLLSDFQFISWNDRVYLFHLI